MCSHCVHSLCTLTLTLSALAFTHWFLAYVSLCRNVCFHSDSISALTLPQWLLPICLTLCSHSAAMIAHNLSYSLLSLCHNVCSCSAPTPSDWLFSVTCHYRENPRELRPVSVESTHTKLGQRPRHRPPSSVYTAGFGHVYTARGVRSLRLISLFLQLLAE